MITTNGNFNYGAKPGKWHAWSAQGTFGGGTLKLQWSHDGTTWTNFKDDTGNDLQLTAAGAFDVKMPSNQARMVLSGASSPNLIANLTAA